MLSEGVEELNCPVIYSNRNNLSVKVIEIASRPKIAPGNKGVSEWVSKPKDDPR